MKLTFSKPTLKLRISQKLPLFIVGVAMVTALAIGIAAGVEEQSAATQEIARNVDQAATGTKEVTSNIVGVQQAAGETGQAANQVLEASGHMFWK